MLTFMLAAAITAQPEPPRAATPPLQTNFIVYGDYGPPDGESNIQRLLNEWVGERTIRGTVRRAPLRELQSCLQDRGRRVDRQCVLRHIMSGPRRRRTVAILSVDSGRVIPVYQVTCVGPGGSASIEVNMNFGGAFASRPLERAEHRANIADCIAAASQASIVRRSGDPRSFSYSGSQGTFFYHRVLGDCAELRHTIGRNAVGGDYRAPLAAVRWSLATPTRVRLDCLEGACISARRREVQRSLTTHQIPFESEMRAQRYLRDVEALRRACR